MSLDKQKVKSFIDGISNLPTIPKTGMRIIQLAMNPEVSMERLGAAIQQDPSLASRVLKVANSPYYGASRRVDSLPLALIILGLREIQHIILGITFFNAMKNLHSKNTHYRESFWLHSAACGVVARILSKKLGFRSEGADFAAGLLHDLGKIAIDACFDGKFVATFNKTFSDKTPMIVAEREILGDTHEKIGGMLARKWQLPKTLCDAIECHHEFPSMRSFASLKDPRIVAISYLSEAFCQHYEIGWDGDSGDSELDNTRAWEVLLRGHNVYNPRDIDIIITETLQVFKEVSPHLLWE